MLRIHDSMIDFFFIAARERAQNTYALAGWGSRRIITNPFKNIGICRVLRYDWGEEGQNLGKSRYILCGRP
jgi:hypothetical protein